MIAMDFNNTAGGIVKARPDIQIKGLGFQRESRKQ